MLRVQLLVIIPSGSQSLWSMFVQLQVKIDGEESMFYKRNVMIKKN